MVTLTILKENSAKMQPKLKGILTNCVTEEVSTVELEYEILEQLGENPEGILTNERRSFQLINGVTGYESFYIDSDLRNVKRMCEKGWCACAGTKGSWDRLVIPADEMKKVDWEAKK